jgi:hypothetical protein
LVRILVRIADRLGFRSFEGVVRSMSSTEDAEVKSQSRVERSFL